MDIKLRERIVGKMYIPYGFGMYAAYIGMRRDLTELPQWLDFLHLPFFHTAWSILFFGSTTVGLVVSYLTLNWKKPAELYDAGDPTGRAFLPILYALMAIGFSEIVIWLVNVSLAS